MLEGLLFGGGEVWRIKNKSVKMPQLFLCWAKEFKGDGKGPKKIRGKGKNLVEGT